MRNIMYILLLMAGVVVHGQGTIKPNLPPMTPAPVSKPAPASSPKPVSVAGANVQITWQGPGSVKLLFDNEEFFFTEGQQKTLALKPDHAYILKAVKPDKTYSYNDFIGFVKGTQYYTVSLAGGSLSVAKTMSPEEQQAAEKAAAAQLLTSFSSNMVYIPGGTFTMGCTSEQGSDCYSDESPAHRVTLSSYSIGKYEVTQAQWRAVMGTNPSNFSGCDQCPVEQVSWDDVQEFTRKLNSLTGKAFRLPTEAEWEYAARGGGSSRGYKYAGGNDIGSVGWYDSNSGDKTHPVGQKVANELGLYDMSGNVLEWCSDWYGDYSSSAQSDPTGTSSGAFRVSRGGSWYDGPQGCRVSYRYYYTPSIRSSNLGFRLVLE